MRPQLGLSGTLGRGIPTSCLHPWMAKPGNVPGPPTAFPQADAQRTALQLLSRVLSKGLWEGYTGLSAPCSGEPQRVALALTACHCTV
jgi:hypothetical protein